MTINNGTKKIEAPSKRILCTYYVGSSVCRILLRIVFCFVCSLDVLLLWSEKLFERFLFASPLLKNSLSWRPSLLGVLSESCCIWNIFHSRSTLLLDSFGLFLIQILLLCNLHFTTDVYVWSGFPSRWLLFVFIIFCMPRWRVFFLVVMSDFLFILLVLWGNLQFELICDIAFSLFDVYLSTTFWNCITFFSRTFSYCLLMFSKVWMNSVIIVFCLFILLFFDAWRGWIN